MVTTMSANKYNEKQSRAMSAHIDSGDYPEGLSTMAVFKDGDYSGAYLTFPQYGVAVDIPDSTIPIDAFGEPPIPPVETDELSKYKVSPLVYPDAPPPPLFTGKKERDLVKQVSDEVIERVIGQQILYYPISIEETNFHPVYGEALNKSFLNPISPSWSSRTRAGRRL